MMEEYLHGYDDVEQRQKAMMQAAVMRNIRYFATDPTEKEIQEYNDTVRLLEEARKKGQTVDVDYD